MSRLSVVLLWIGVVLLAGCEPARPPPVVERQPGSPPVRSHDPGYWEGRHPIRVSIGYPSEYIPKMTVCAQHTVSRRETCVNLGANAQNFEVVMHLEPGTYTVHARNIAGYTGIVHHTTAYNPDGTMNPGITRPRVLTLPADRNALVALDFYNTLGERVKVD